MGFQYWSLLWVLSNSIIYAQAQDTTLPVCTLGFATPDSVARVCACDGANYPLLDDPFAPDACAYTSLPANPIQASATDVPAAASTGDTFIAQETTITNADGSSFTALLEPMTDATGGVSTLTVTVNAVAGGEPSSIQAPPPPSLSTTDVPAPPSSTDDPGVFTAQETTITNADGSSFTALLEPFTDATGGVSTSTITVNAVAGGEPSTTASPSSTTALILPPFFVTTISGSLETFSQTLFPDLATITAPVTVTTPLAETDSNGGTTIIPVPIIIGPGGVGYVGPVGPLPPDIPFPDPIPGPGPAPGPGPGPAPGPGPDPAPGPGPGPGPGPAPGPAPGPGPAPPPPGPPPPGQSPTDPPTNTDSEPTASCTSNAVPQCTASCVDDGSSLACPTTVCTTATDCSATGFTTSVTTTTSQLPAPTVSDDIETERPADDASVDVLVQVFLTSLYSALGINDNSPSTQAAPTGDPASPSTTQDPPPLTSSFGIPPGPGPCLTSDDCPQSGCSSDQTPICDIFNGQCTCGSSSINIPLVTSSVAPPPLPPSPPPMACVDQSLSLGVVVCQDYPCNVLAACQNGFCVCPSGDAPGRKRDVASMGTTLEKVYLPITKI